jgi:hypothetical protein
MNRMTKTFMLITFFTGISNLLQAQLIWNFTTAAVTGTVTNITTVSNVTQGNNNGTTTFLAAELPASSDYTGFSAGFNGSCCARTGVLSTVAATGSAYVQVVLTPAAGYAVNISSIRWGNFSIPTTGPTTLSIYASNDNFTTATHVVTLPTVAPNATAWVSLFSTTAITGLTGTALTIRIYASGGTGAVTAGVANWRVDDLIITATAQTGTAGQIPKYTDATTFANSIITENNNKIGIGTTTPAEKLDINGNLKFTGALLAGATPTGGVDGQFLKSTGPTTAPVWFTAPTGSAGWGLTGNAGTIPGTNFIGTTDNMDLIFKRNGVISGKLTGSNTSFGVGARVGNPVTGGDSDMSVAIGSNALANSLELNQITAIGSGALFSFIGGEKNTAVGASSLYNLIYGQYNTANGCASLNTLTTGSYNTAIGLGSGNGITTGNYNTIIGKAFGLPANLNNNIILADGEGNRRININELGNVGIGTITPAAKLDIAGNIKITDGSQGANKVLTSDANGLASWQAAPSATATAWGLLGNAGTDPYAVTNASFIGTTDDKDLVFKRNGIISGRLSGYYSTSFGVGALGSMLSSSNATAIGAGALKNELDGYENTAVGVNALYNANESEYNTAIGGSSLYSVTFGNRNTSIGVASLHNLATGNSNTSIGVVSLLTLTTGNRNIAIGDNAGRGVTTGSNNVFIGGTGATDLPTNLSNNIILADGAGNRRININELGNVGIGTITPAEKLDVNGNIYTTGKILIGQTNTAAVAPYALAVNGWAIFTKATVKLNANWPDYVFEPTYKLPTLAEVEAYLTRYKHLPDMPSAATVKEKGIDLGDNQTILVKKVEELTLYIIALNKKVDTLVKENEELKKKPNQDN